MHNMELTGRTGKECRMEHFRRAGAVLLSIGLLFVMLFFFLFEISEIGHDCCGEGCLVCRCMETAESFRQLLTGDGIGRYSFEAGMMGSVIPVLLCAEIFSAATPVTQKVRLNN